MNEQLIQARYYNDTFKGGAFEVELRENLSLIGSFGNGLNDVKFVSHDDPKINQDIDAMWKMVLT